eukprot:6521357-Prymnesium_polylepis.1
MPRHMPRHMPRLVPRQQATRSAARSAAHLARERVESEDGCEAAHMHVALRMLERQHRAAEEAIRRGRLLRDVRQAASRRRIRPAREHRRRREGRPGRRVWIDQVRGGRRADRGADLGRIKCRTSASFAASVKPSARRVPPASGSSSGAGGCTAGTARLARQNKVSCQDGTPGSVGVRVQPQRRTGWPQAGHSVRVWVCRVHLHCAIEELKAGLLLE